VTIGTGHPRTWIVAVTFESVLPLGDEVRQIRKTLTDVGFRIRRVEGHAATQTIYCRRCKAYHGRKGPHTVNPGMVGRKVWTG